jgi:Uma2 family endonuclease
MAEAGIFGDDERLELSDGEIVPMSPQGPKHISATRRTARQMRRVFGEEDWSVREEKALALGTDRERYPDVVVARGGDDIYDDRIAEAADVALVIEVADTTLHIDRDVKAREYATAGIPEYWIVNLPERRLEVYRDPADGGYRSRRRFEPEQEGSVGGGARGCVHPGGRPAAATLIDSAKKARGPRRFRRGPRLFGARASGTTASKGEFQHLARGQGVPPGVQRTDFLADPGQLPGRDGRRGNAAVGAGLVQHRQQLVVAERAAGGGRVLQQADDAFGPSLCAV